MALLALALPAVASANTYTVDTLNPAYSPYGCEDDLECSLSSAIGKANIDEEEDTIEFSVAGTIELESETLPWIIHPVTIDATTAPGYAGSPVVAIDGEEAQSEGLIEGLTFLDGAGGSRVEGLAIGNFELGMFVAGGSAIWVCANFLGVGLDGTTAFPNDTGIETAGAGARIGAECSNGGNVISGNTAYGLTDFGEGTVIGDNRIGIDAAGDPMPNGRPTSIGAGILVSSVAEEPFIGGIPGDEGFPANDIRYNEGAGILVEDAASNASIRRNRIYANSEAAIKINSVEKTPAPLVEFGEIEAGETEISGTIHGEPDSDYLIDVYASTGCYLNGAGQAESYLGGLFVTTGPDGTGVFSGGGLDAPPGDYEFLSATAASLPAGSTSEIGPCTDVPPDTEITSSPPDPTPFGEATFEFSGSDPNGSVGGFECSLDGAPFSACTSPQAYADLADGSHTFEVLARDQLATADPSPASYEWEVDTTHPAVFFESLPPNPTNQTAATVEFNVTDFGGSGVASVSCKLDAGQLLPCSSPVTYSSLPAGSHQVQVWVTDNAGNTSFDFYDWTIDTTLPSITSESAPADPSNQSTAVFTFSAGDTGGSGLKGTECSLDSAPLTPCSSPVEYSSLADGSHVFEVRASDNAGNTIGETFHWTVDTVAAATTIDSQPSNPSTDIAPSFTFSGTDPGGSGVAGFECKLDGGSFGLCASPKALSGLGDGEHSFEVRARDGVGNVDATPATYAWTVDSSIPDPPDLTATDPGSPANDNAPLVIGSAEEGTTVSLFASGDCTGTPITTTATPAELGAGIEVSVADDAVTEFSATATSPPLGTSACSLPLTYREDSTAPTAEIGDPTPSDPSKSSSASFVFGGDDGDGSGVAGFECSLDAGEFSACASPAGFSGLADGAHVFEVRAIDAAGNTDPDPASFSWRIDTSVPPQVQAAAQPLLQTATVIPDNGESVAVAPEEGKVLVQRPGQKKPTELKEGQTIPVGSLVDATNGKVLLTSVNAAGETQSAVFYGGKFLVQQHDGSGLVILELKGGDFNSCGSEARKSGATTSGRKGRRLWGSGHGNFRTEGSYGSATVQGTIWFTEDRCGSTFFKVRRGVVSIRDFGAGKTFPLPAGKSYLAKP
ncbi:MAG TPA: hypothetical protein VFJ57_04410 [Solirubrobacterales bacterium]|nr:hypothetical protein [Solirubrobacterales bacterium]